MLRRKRRVRFYLIDPEADGAPFMPPANRVSRLEGTLLGRLAGEYLVEVPQGAESRVLAVPRGEVAFYEILA